MENHFLSHIPVLVISILILMSYHFLLCNLQCLLYEVLLIMLKFFDFFYQRFLTFL